jgi:hypothetical protein
MTSRLILLSQWLFFFGEPVRDFIDKRFSLCGPVHDSIDRRVSGDQARGLSIRCRQNMKNRDGNSRVKDAAPVLLINRDILQRA